MIYILPIEKYQERYSSWWYDYIPKKVSDRGMRCCVIDGESLSDTVETGTVLDAAGTNYYKSKQLSVICQKFKTGEIKPYDAFLVCDVWFPGLEMLRYMSQLYNIPITIWGIWHAGSITSHDFAEPMNPWSKYFEMGWINMCDGVFVGSEYSRISLLERLAMPVFSGDPVESEELTQKLYAYGMPLDFTGISEVRQANINRPKNNIILFPHRPDEEKNPRLFMDVVEHLSCIWDDFENWQFVFCTSKQQYKSRSPLINSRLACLRRSYKNIQIFEGLKRQEYYELLDRTKIAVSTTREENFGYCMVEAAAFGCNIVAPNNFSHPEIFDEDYRLLYDDESEIASKIVKLAKDPIPSEKMAAFVEPYTLTVDTWIDIIGGKRR